MLAHTSNISREGLFVRSPRPPPPGTEVELTIPDLSVRAHAVVQWRVSGPAGQSGAGLVLRKVIEGERQYDAHVKRLAAHSGEHSMEGPDGAVRVPRPRRNTRRTGPGTRG